MTANMPYVPYTHTYVYVYMQHWKMLIYSLVSEFVTKFHLCDIMLVLEKKHGIRNILNDTLSWAELLHFSRNSYYVRLAVVVLWYVLFSLVLLVSNQRMWKNTDRKCVASNEKWNHKNSYVQRNSGGRRIFRNQKSKI